MRLFYFLAFAIVILGASACTRPHTASETTAPVTVAPPVMVPVAVDLPSYVGTTIEEVRKRLGPPRESQLEPLPAQLNSPRRKSLRIKDEGWANTFQTGGVTIIVTFNARTRLVRDIVLTGNNEEVLMQRGNLTLTAPSYIVLPVRDPKNASELLGVRVIGRR